MTDLDPLEKTPPEGSELPARAGRELPRDPEHAPNQDMAGPTGRQMTTESVGDPDRASVSSGAEAGAGGGAMAGAAIAGPIGLPIGAAAGAIVGAGAEAADVDRSTNEPGPLSDSGSEGTISDGASAVDPATDYRPDQG
jgi:hypothetical protein